MADLTNYFAAHLDWGNPEFYFKKYNDDDFPFTINLVFDDDVTDNDIIDIFCKTINHKKYILNTELLKFYVILKDFDEYLNYQEYVVLFKFNNKIDETMFLLKN